MIKKSGCILIDIENNKIALVCRKGKYSFPKGHLEEGETLQECAIRETREETGHNCHIVGGKEISVIYFNNSKGEEVENFFYLAVDDGLSNETINVDDREKTVWVRYDDVKSTLSHKNLRILWDNIKIKVKDVVDNG